MSIAPEERGHLDRVVEQIADEAVKFYRARDRLLNDPAAYTLRLQTLARIEGLRIALCFIKGWDVEEESDKEGAADKFVVARWQETYPEEWSV